MTHCVNPPLFDMARNAIDQASSPLVIVAASGTGGDIQPFIQLSQGLAERGHRVLMLVPRFHEAAVLGSGVPCQTFGTQDEWQALLNDPDLWDERKGWSVIWKGLVPHLGALRNFIHQLPADAPCVVLSHPILVPMAALARSVRPDLRIVTAYLAPSNLCSSHDLLCIGSLRIPSWVPTAWRQALWSMVHQFLIDPITIPSLNAERSRHDLPRVPNFFGHVSTAPDASLGLFPTWFASVQPDWPPSFTEGDFVNAREDRQAPLPLELEQFLSAGDPPIVFTPGTGHLHAAHYFNTALKALARLQRRGLFVTPHEAQLPDSLPASVMWQAHVPFTALLPRVAAVVHHGGIGTTAEAFRAGVPQLIVPFAYDQFDNGLRAKRLGVADVLMAKHLSVRRMQRRLASLLASREVRQACAQLAQTSTHPPGLPRLLDLTEAALFQTPPNAVTPGHG